MSKNSKARRDSKKRKKQSQAKGRKNHKAVNTPKETGPFLQELVNPFASLNEEQRKQAIIEIADTSRQTVEQELATIETIFRQHDPLCLLSTLSAYGLTSGVGQDGVEYKEHPSGFHQFHLELAQAICLTIPNENIGMEVVLPEITQKLWDSLIKLGSSIAFARLDNRSNSISNQTLSIERIQDMFRGNTQAVRNWGFFSQVKRISQDLYSQFDEDVRGKYQFTPSDIIRTFSLLIRNIEKSISGRMQNLAELKKIKNKNQFIKRYYEIIGQGEEESTLFLQSIDFNSTSLEQLFFMTIAHYDLLLDEIYLFDPKEIGDQLNIETANMVCLLDYFSLNYGDIPDTKKKNLFLDNPVWLKPIIKSEGRYFCPLPQLFFSFIVPIMNSLIEPINSQKFSRVKSVFLENQVENIVKKRFPESQIITGMKWKYKNEQYETDLIAFIDSHAVIIESKSQKISNSALRGAPDRIRRHLNDILIKPSLQSKRLENRLNELIDDPSIEDDIRNQLPIDLSKIHQVVRVSVSLEDFASLQVNSSYFSDTGWIPNDFSPCPTLNLADFEILFDLLDHPVQIIHYLRRRAELEGKISFIGCELDVMGLYISTLLTNPEFDGKPLDDLVISGMSEYLDTYYNSKDAGVILEKPKPAICLMFQKIFNRLEERSTPRWTEIGVILNRFSPDEQSKLMDYIENLHANVSKHWSIEGHKNIVYLVPSKSSEYSFSYLAYNNNNRERRDEYINQAARVGMEASHVKTCLVIAKNVDDDTYPYHFIGLFQ